MGALFGAIGIVGMGSCLVLMIINVIRKQSNKKLALGLLACFILLIIGVVITPNKSKDSSPQSPVVTEAVTETVTEEKSDAISEEATEEITESNTSTEEAADNNLSFVLGGEVGEYGKEVTLNAGTDFEENEIMFHIPAGSYTVTNNSSAATQLTVYSGGPEKDGEWETFVDDGTCPKPVVIMGGETGDFEIGEGQFLVLSDGSENILFEMK